METVRFHIAQMSFFLRIFFFRIYWVPVNNLAPMRNCPGGGGMQGSLNLPPTYRDKINMVPSYDHT